MRAATALRVLGPIDARSIRRDSFLAWLLILLPVVCAALRWGIPALAGWLDARFAFDLTPWYPLVMSFVPVQLVSTLVGTVLGFMLLDERDGDTLRALLVTPLPIAGYLAYRIGLPLLLALALTLFAVYWVGLVVVPWHLLLPAALLYALEAPLLTLAIATVCQNKVQGFAFVKGVGILPLIAVASYFVAPPWQYLAGIVPTWWPVKLFWIASGGGGSGYGLVFGLGLAFHLLALWAMLRAFERAVHRH